MASDELDKVEQPALDQLQRLGWDYIPGKQLSPEESNERANQFERWWDKYSVSLHEIDTQVKESENVMWGYLKELGYE